jgi:hypothetical protein
MNSNDARLARLFTVETGGLVEDNSPNTRLTTPLTTFDLFLEGEAGNNIGGNGAQYTLTIVCFDWTTGNLANAALQPTIPPQTFDAPGPLWTPSGTDFITQQRFRIPASGNLPTGLGNHIFTYTAALVSRDFNLVSLIQSNLFILVQ